MPDYTESKATRQYLKKYAEPEVESIPVTRTFDYCLVIPAFDERWVDLQQVWQHLTGDFLVILVINAPEPHEATLNLLREIQDNVPATQKTQTNRCCFLPGSPDILIVDRCTAGNTINSRQGVGLARKIGADIALQLLTDGRLKQGRISVTDADAVLPADYFDCELDEGEAACVFPFHHIPGSSLDEKTDDNTQLSVSLFEASIVYYAAGLTWAGSHYGFTTLGSCMAISPGHYAQVRGFPKRAAAEDFYLLNKLAKTGSIVRSDSAPILLSGRVSERVPLGTGPGIRKISALECPLQDYTFYHPGTFVLLKEFLSLLAHYWDSSGDINNASKEIRHFWDENNIGELFSRQRSGINQEVVFSKFVVDWFDAFKTLKFIHFIRFNYLPSVPLSRLGQAPFVDSNLLEDLPALKDHLMHGLFARSGTTWK